MSYADITFADKNPIKRWLQRARLTSAIELFAPSRTPPALCDFGAANGEFCKLLCAQFPKSKVFCYEPNPLLLAEAKENLADLGSQIVFTGCEDELPRNGFDGVFCLEVLEHLPKKESANCLETIYSLMTIEGQCVIGVPVEVGLPAFYKGIFRAMRRYGAYDANIFNIFRAVCGKPPKDRPVSEIAPGIRFHFEHMGFDHRELLKLASPIFHVILAHTSPWRAFGSTFMPEINFLLKKN